MNWILIAITSGMLMTSQHDTEEQCLGRKAMLEKDKITNSKCVDMMRHLTTTTLNGNSGITFCDNSGVCR